MTSEMHKHPLYFPVFFHSPLCRFLPSVLILLVLGIHQASAYNEQAPHPPKVLIIYGRVSQLHAHQIINNGLLPALKKAGFDDADQYQEYLDLQRHPDPAYPRELARFLSRKYSGTKFDAIVVFHGDAWNFMKSEGKDLFRGVPMVAVVPKETETPPGLGRKVIQLVYSLDALHTLRYALALLPDTKEIIVVSGPTMDDAPYLEAAQDALKNFTGTLSVRYLTNNSLPGILQEVGKRRDHTIILYTRLTKDSSGNSYLPTAGVSDISRASKSPVFGLYDSLLGSGIVGGDLLSFGKLGEETARLAGELIAGKAGYVKEVSFLKHAPMFDWNEIRRWGLDKSRLPKGSVLINYRPGFWEQYWGYIGIAILLVAGEGALIVFLVWNRRKRLQAEAESRASERLLQSYLSNNSIVSWMKDEDGRHVFRNDTFCKRFAAESKNWYGKTDYELWPQDLAEVFRIHDHQVLASGTSLETIEPVVDATGMTSWWLTTKFLFKDATGKRFVGGLGVDVTELKKVQDEAERQHAMMMEIINATDVCLVYLDLDFNFVAVNSAYAATCRLRPEEMVGRNHFSLYPGGEVEALFRQVRDTGIPAYIKERPFEFPDQPERGVTYWDWSLIPVRDSTGNVIGLVFSLLETTERKMAQEEHLKLERQLQDARRMESLGILAGGIAHDFNNILTAIIGNAELALLQADIGSSVRENLKRIEKSAEKAADLARQMLAYSGKGKFVVESVDLNGVIEKQGRVLMSSITSKAELILNLTKPIPLIEADASQISQIVTNLVLNASESIGDQPGTITVSTSWRDCDRHCLDDGGFGGAVPEGRYVLLEIRDTGCGMNKETQEKIFDPFFSTKFTGRGLGLPAVQGIVRGHKGAIRVNSEPDKGSTFSVLLPCCAERDS
ncbi:PAS domain-containing sensor histidine kinase [Geomonas subterranea]|uniref:PAS domain-containing sensor histidine kinase n=1 Tax=Geomonas subterranea TaxID=2847989 RepID=UPI001CD54EED|nr:PAS domain-containing sensor histidine kinase [Geomonas fuzhouensis]